MVEERAGGGDGGSGGGVGSVGVDESSDLVQDAARLEPNCRIIWRWGGNVGDVEGTLVTRSKANDW